MRKIFLLLLIIIVVAFPGCIAQYEDTLFVAFWNLENRFETVDDPSINDELFLPNGEMECTEDCMIKKVQPCKSNQNDK